MFAVGAGAKVVATDDFSDTPPEARGLRKVGGVQPNAERIAALKPDLVLAAPTANQPQLAASLRAVDVPLESVRIDHIADIAPAMRTIGARLGAPRTEAAIAEFHRALEAQRRTRKQKPRVLFVVLTTPLYVAGRKSFADELFEITGAENAVDVEGWPQYSLEPLAVNSPDVILFSSPSVSRAQMNELIASAAKVRANAKIVAVDEALFSRAGPRIPQAAAALNAILDGVTPRPSPRRAGTPVTTGPSAPPPPAPSAKQ